MEGHEGHEGGGDLPDGGLGGVWEMDGDGVREYLHLLLLRGGDGRGWRG